MTKEEAIKILEQRVCCGECVADCTCDECKEAFEMAIRALKNEQSDGDLVSLQALSEKLRKYKPVIYTENTKEMELQNIFDILTEHTALLNDIKMMIPSAEKTAEWIFYMADNDGNDGNEEKWCKCSKCGYKEFYLPPKRNICPNCGARMGVGE